MKIKKSNLTDKLKNIKNIVLPKNGGIQGVLLQEGQLIATNRDLTIVAKIEPLTPSDESFIIPQSAFAYIENVPSDDIEIKLSGKYITIKSGKSSTKFATYPVADFPVIAMSELKEQNNLFAGSLFKNSIESVWNSANSNSPKTIAKGILFNGDGKTLDIVACDGMRASWTKMDSDNIMNMLIPKETLKKVIPLIEDDDEVCITKSTSGNKAVIKTDKYTIYTNLYEGTYLDYKALIQYSDETVCVSVDRKSLISCVNRCQLCSDRISASVMSMDGEQLNISRSSTTCEFSESVPADFDVKRDGAEIKVGFNTAYLLEALKNCNADKVLIHYVGPLKPMVITMKDEQLRHLIVPMRLQ